METSVAFCGLGAMGRSMAARLAAYLSSGQAPGFAATLLVQNRTTSKAEEFARQTPSTQAVTRVAELAPAGVVFSCLADDAATDAVLAELLAAVAAQPAGQQPAAAQRIFVNCATVLPATVKRQSTEAAAAGVLYINCPVFGRPDAAAGGALVAVPAGPAAGRERLAALLPAFAGRGVWDLGDDPAASAVLKLTGNFWIVSQVEIASQCLALAAKSGIESSHVLRMLETFLDSPIALGYAKRIAAGDYSTDTGFGIDLALKDVNHMRAVAQEATCPLPAADMAHSHLLQVKAKHGVDLDWGAIHLAVRDAAGLPPNFSNKQ